MGRVRRWVKKNWTYIRIVLTWSLILAAWVIYINQEMKEQPALAVQSNKIETEVEIREESAQDNYSDNIFQLSISVLVAVETISITIFIFLKSLLDRNTDERSYLKRIMGYYNQQMSKMLLILTIESILLLIYGFVFYSSRFLSFKFGYFHWLIGWLLPIVLYIVGSVQFWRECIYNKEKWIKLAEEQIGVEEREIEKLLPVLKSADDTEICVKDTDWKRFTYIFTKLEEFLILGIDAKYSVYTDGEERIRDYLLQNGLILNKSLEQIEKADLKEEKLFGELSEKRKQYLGKEEDLSQLYGHLVNCRDYFLVNMIDPRQVSDRQISEEIWAGLNLFERAILIGKLRNHVIEGMIYEAPTFRYVDFYGSRLENLILTGAYFEKSILARMQIENTNLTMGYYKNSLLMNIRVSNSSLLSSFFIQVKISKASFIDTEFSNSQFKEGRIENSSFENSNLSDSEFHDMVISQVSFADTVLENIEFSGKTEIIDSSFARATIGRWKIKSDMLKPFQDFTDAIMTGFCLGDKSLQTDASGNNFTGASLFNGHFCNLSMHGSVFRKCNMTGMEMENVLADSSDMREANLYQANIHGSERCKSSFCDCDLTNVNAVEALITDANFSRAVCTGMDLSGARISCCDWSGADMKKTILSETVFTNVIFEDVNFTESVWENTVFQCCTFQNVILQKTRLRKVRMINCNFSSKMRKKLCKAGVKIEDKNL